MACLCLRECPQIFKIAGVWGKDRWTALGCRVKHGPHAPPDVIRYEGLKVGGDIGDLLLDGALGELSWGGGVVEG